MSISDFHTHILPGIDDGSRSLEISEKMLDIQAAQGVEQIVLTPHFYADENRIERFLSRRSTALEALLPLAASRKISLIPGAEVAYFDAMSRAEGLEQLCLEGSRLMLLELPFRQWNRRDLDEIEGLLDKKYELILAHLERYIPFQRDKSILETLLTLPLLVQINAESLLTFRSRRMVLKLFAAGKAHLLGSDCHNLDSRRPNLAEGRGVLQKKLGPAFLEEMDARGSQLIALCSPR